jgi:hypothetical protein
MLKRVFSEVLLFFLDHISCLKLLLNQNILKDLSAKATEVAL